MIFLIMIAMCFFTSTGQVLVKRGINQRMVQGVTLKNLLYFFEPHILIGGFLVLISPLLYLKVLSLTGLSEAYGLNGLSYIIVYLMGVFILKERGSFLQSLGILLITGGIILWSI